jgi:hypothetical protein
VERGFSIVDFGIKKHGMNVEGKNCNSYNFLNFVEFEKFNLESLVWPQETRDKVKDAWYKSNGYWGTPAVTGYWLLVLASKFPIVHKGLQANERR